MNQDQKLTNKVINFSNKIGIDIIGFANPDLFDRFSGENRPRSFLKEPSTVIIVGIHLYDIMLDVWSNAEEIGKSFQFADSILRNFCYSMSKFLFKQGFKSKIIPYHPGLYLKDAAALAGIGPIGKNNLLITKEYGSQIRLSAIVTTAPLILGKPVYESRFCEECNICIDACPVNALKNGVYDKKVCRDYNYSNWKILSTYTRLWCNKCIEACPVGKKSK